MMFYMRIHDKFGNMIALFLQCIFDLTSFAIFFVSLLLLFSLTSSLLNNEVYDKYYPSMNYFTEVLVHTYRNAIGDIHPPGYSYWSDAMLSHK